MPSGLERYYGRGDLHFITFSCYRRLPFLGSSGARNLFVRELARVRREYGFLLLGYVVMPEHVHLLLSEPRRGTPSTVLQMLKQRVSHKMRKKRRSPAAGTASPELSRAARESAQLLASAVLRFQRKHKRENKRKTRVHTSQPDKPGTSRASQGLAVEQLGVLRKNRVRTSFYRRSSGMKDKDERSRKPKTHPLTPRVGHAHARSWGYYARARTGSALLSIDVRRE